MKKFLSLIILPLIAIMCLCACDSDKSYEDLKKLYQETTQICVIDEDNKFFANESKPNTITIKYSIDVQNAISNDNPVTNLQEKYVVLAYQQQLLDYIFNYYENNCEEFYKKISSAKVDKKDLNNLYNNLHNLNETLGSFKEEYNSFCDATKNVTDAMEFNLTNYSYELNKVIGRAFDFIYNFMDVFEKYCISNYDFINATNLQYKIDKTYVDIANIIYLTNFKVFDYSVGTKGISDMGALIDSGNEFVLISDLNNLKSLSPNIMAGLDEGSASHTQVMGVVNDYLYSLDVFHQRLTTFKQIYNSENVYDLAQVKFGLVSGVDYQSYLSTMTKSKLATIEFMDNFVLDTYAKMVVSLGMMVNLWL